MGFIGQITKVLVFHARVSRPILPTHFAVCNLTHELFYFIPLTTITYTHRQNTHHSVFVRYQQMTDFLNVDLLYTVHV